MVLGYKEEVRDMTYPQFGIEFMYKGVVEDINMLNDITPEPGLVYSVLQGGGRYSEYLGDGSTWIELIDIIGESDTIGRSDTIGKLAKYKLKEKCPNCGAPLNYKGTEQTSGYVYCQYCSTTIQLDDADDYYCI